jgi:shikimate kinase
VVARSGATDPRPDPKGSQPLAVAGVRKPWRSAVVELVGPAGSGKSSVLRALARRDHGLLPGLRLRKHRHVRTAVTLLPTYVALHWPPRGLLWPEMKRVTYLGTLWRTLEREANGAYRTILLDEGPVYYHARALVYGGRRVIGHGFERWWRRSLQAWAAALDAVVWLDAPDPVLTARIRSRPPSRPVDFRVRDLPDSAVAQILSNFRRAYERVLADLNVAGGPRVVRIDTARDSVEAIVDRLLADELPSTNGGGRA